MPRGRRPGRARTRETIVGTARRMFQEQGFAQTSLRAIAREAEVDPSLVHHYFEGKPALFVEAVLGEGTAFDPQKVVRAAVRDGDPGEIGVRLVRGMVEVWDRPEIRESLRALLLSLGEQSLVVGSVQGAVTEVLEQELVEVLGVDRPDYRAALAFSQVIGLAMTRYVLFADSPLAAAPPEEIAAVVGPTVQGYLTGELPA